MFFFVISMFAVAAVYVLPCFCLITIFQCGKDDNVGALEPTAEGCRQTTLCHHSASKQFYTTLMRFGNVEQQQKWTRPTAAFFVSTNMA